MTNPVPKVGDRIRVSDEGTVVHVAGPQPTSKGIRTRLTVEASDGRRKFYWAGPGSTSTLEILEPAYVDDGVYKDADGDFYQYCAEYDNWLEFGSEIPCWLGHPTRPLTRIDV